MKSPSALVLAAVLAFPSLHVTSFAGTPNQSPTAVLIAQLDQATPENRQKLIAAAIANNPAIASNLVAALITHFPSEAAAMTKLVVDAVVGLGIPDAQKSELLRLVAQKAVQAALHIPRSAVTDLIATVNAVKAVLADIPEALKPAVAAYIIPISELPPIETNTKPIVSSDTL